MDISDVWDWAFFWSMFRNFTATISPFVMIPVAIAAVTMLILAIVLIVKAMRS